MDVNIAPLSETKDKICQVRLQQVDQLKLLAIIMHVISFKNCIVYSSLPIIIVLFHNCRTLCACSENKLLNIF